MAWARHAVCESALTDPAAFMFGHFPSVRSWTLVLFHLGKFTVKEKQVRIHEPQSVGRLYSVCGVLLYVWLLVFLVCPHLIHTFLLTFFLSYLLT